MRPIKLTLNAFGAYAQKNVIDFEKLGKEGIYLVTGDTGAGKTTIFDGIIFALYGEFSGQNRSVQMARSAYADEKDKTSVELVFECSGKRYTIIRKLNIDKDLKVTQKVQLEFDHKVVSKKSDADRKIENIVGVNKDQFRQIIMLAQGDFQKMLFAKSTDRQEILRKILDTGSYNLFQEKLKERFGEAKKKYEAKQSELLATISNSNLEEEPINQNIQATPDEVEKFCRLLGQINKNDETELKKIKSYYDQKQKEYQKVVDEINSIEKNNNLYTQIETLKNSIEQKSLENKQNEKKSKEVNEKNQPQIEKALQEVYVLKQSLEEYQKLDSIVEEIKKLTKYSADMKASFERGKKILEDAQCELNTLTERQQACSSLENESLEAEREKINSRQKMLVSAEQDYLKYQSKKAELLKYQSEYKKSTQEATQQENYSRILRQHYDSQRAGIMAEKLVEGEPCPVCGSIHHPCKAVKTDEIIDKNMVEQAEQRAEKMRKNANQLCSKCEGLKATCMEIGGNIKKYLNDLEIEIGDLQSEIQKVKSAIDILDKKIEKENQRKAELENLEQQIPQKQEQIEDINSKLAKLNEKIVSFDVSIKEKSQNAQSLKNRLKFAGRQEAEKEIEKIESHSKQLKQEMDYYQDIYNKSKENLLAMQTKMDTLYKQLPQDYKPTDILAEKYKQQDNFKAEIERINSDILVINTRLSNNKKIFEKLSAEFENLKNLEFACSQIGALNSIANGTGTSGKMKFEAFVQVEFFKEILQKANAQLNIMSGGRFEFIRKDIPNDNRTDHTLDIDILDYYSGKSRDVKSLSGGESFIASLSLALGLSQSVQENAGGIQIETMFVDEGFGTLDDNSLNQAMNALNHLSQGNRLIGIISHVDLLKKNISKQIVVKKNGANGSKADIVV